MQVHLLLSLVIFLHVMGVTFWVGGIFVYMLALTPSLLVISPPERGKLMGAFLKRFALLTWGAIILVLTTGAILVGTGIGFANLFSFNSRYGITLLVKIILVIVMIINGAYLGLVLGPRLASFAPPRRVPEPAGSGEAGPPPGPPPELLRLQKRMATLGWVQIGLALAVLLANGLL